MVMGCDPFSVHLEVTCHDFVVQKWRGMQPITRISPSSIRNLSQVIITWILLSLLLQGVIPLCDQQGPIQDRVRYLWDRWLRLRSSPALHFLVLSEGDGSAISGWVSGTGRWGYFIVHCRLGYFASIMYVLQPDQWIGKGLCLRVKQLVLHNRYGRWHKSEVIQSDLLGLQSARCCSQG